jgi:hypothetical protein
MKKSDMQQQPQIDLAKQLLIPNESGGQFLNKDLYSVKYPVLLQRSRRCSTPYPSFYDKETGKILGRYSPT